MPATGYQFVQWSDGSTDNPRTVIVTEDMALTAYFEEIPDALQDTDGDIRTTSPRKVLLDGILYILLPNGRIYDANGKEVR